MTHRIIGEDGGETCYCCGMHGEDGGLAYWPCLGPTNDHPAYVFGDGTFETCSAHPYQGCERLSQLTINDTVAVRILVAPDVPQTVR